MPKKRKLRPQQCRPEAKSIEMADESATRFWYDTRNVGLRPRKFGLSLRMSNLWRCLRQKEMNEVLLMLSHGRIIFMAPARQRKRRKRRTRRTRRTRRKSGRLSFELKELGVGLSLENNEAKANIAEARAKDTEKMRTILR